MAVAMKLGVKKVPAGSTIQAGCEQLDSVVGIHPTLAETMTMMSGEKIEGVVCRWQGLV
ncbi:unnamed protein product [Cladocopium goreaui]|uniref:Uncharacterized protein n=1 Tax=Cladocopium goreaui TaxID=2562237 RepID=A0A9P1CCR8_9DINO|nr:unnamed protein product [Cladocopium goreaui]